MGRELSKLEKDILLLESLRGGLSERYPNSQAKRILAEAIPLDLSDYVGNGKEHLSEIDQEYVTKSLEIVEKYFAVIQKDSKVQEHELAEREISTAFSYRYDEGTKKRFNGKNVVFNAVNYINWLSQKFNPKN